MKGGGFDLLAGGGGGIQVHLIAAPGLGVQLPGGAQDIQGGAHLPAGDMPVINGQNGVGGHAHIVDQSLTGGAEHFRDAAGGAVQKFKGFVTGHLHRTSF